MESLVGLLHFLWRQFVICRVYVELSQPISARMRGLSLHRSLYIRRTSPALGLHLVIAHRLIHIRRHRGRSDGRERMIVEHLRRVGSRKRCGRLRLTRLRLRAEQGRFENGRSGRLRLGIRRRRRLCFQRLRLHRRAADCAFLLQRRVRLRRRHR